MDQLELRRGRRVQAQVVHHILPREQFPEYQYAPWNLISLSRDTHELIHNRITGGLSSIGQDLMMEVANRRGIKLHKLILVIGLPGSGKTTYVKKNLGGGIAYDMDYISAALRLSKPHEEYHKLSRKLANSMMASFAGMEINGTVYIIRSSPSIEEASIINPDELVICTGEYDISGRGDYDREYDKKYHQGLIDEVREWAEANRIPIKMVG